MASSREYVVLIRHRWSSLELLPFNAEIADVMENGCIGFLPVFATREEAEREYPDKQVLEIQEVNDKENDT